MVIKYKETCLHPLGVIEFFRVRHLPICNYLDSHLAPGEEALYKRDGESSNTASESESLHLSG